MFYLYRITNLLNDKVYIGQSNKEKERWRQHKYFARQEAPVQYIHKAMKKYGVENFVYEVIAMCKNQKDADETETMLIKQYDSRNKNFGYNVAPGGDAPWNRGLPKEFNPLTGMPRSEKTKEKISQGSLGKIMPPCSEERKKKMSSMYSGRILPDEWINKIADSNRGQKRSEESKKKMSDVHIGLQAGEKHPMAKLTWKIVSDIRLDYKTGKISHRKLAIKYGISQANVSDILNNKIWKLDTP